MPVPFHYQCPYTIFVHFWSDSLDSPYQASSQQRKYSGFFFRLLLLFIAESVINVFSIWGQVSSIPFKKAPRSHLLQQSLIQLSNLSRLDPDFTLDPYEIVLNHWYQQHEYTIFFSINVHALFSKWMKMSKNSWIHHFNPNPHWMASILGWNPTSNQGHGQKTPKLLGKV